MGRAVLIFLLIAVPRAARPDVCSSAAQQLAQVSRDLDRAAFKNADDALHRLPGSTSDCPSTMLAKARIAAASGDTSAEALLAHYIEIAPNDPQGYAYQAHLFLDKGEYAAADAASAAALEKGPNDPAALAVRGQIVAMKGDRQKGVELLTEASQLSPRLFEAQYQLGILYGQAKLRAEAAAHFQQAVKIDPTDPRAWDYLALNLEHLGDIDIAAEAYKKGVQTNQEGIRFDSFLDYNYGRLLMKEGNLPEAKPHLDRAVQLAPEMRATWYERARLDLLQKEYTLARQDAEMAATLADPDHVILDLQLYALLEQVYRRLGAVELADKYAQLGRETLPPVRDEHSSNE